MLRVIALFLTILLLDASLVAGQCKNTQLLIPPKDKAFQPGFGSAMDSYDKYLLVGSQDHDSLAFGAGIVYLYKLNPLEQWIKIATLAPSDPQAFMSFGREVAIHGTTIIVLGNRYDVDGNQNEKLYVF